MRTAAIRELRNHHTALLERVAAGEEVIITNRGKPVAKLGPVENVPVGNVDWGGSPEVVRVRKHARRLSKQERDKVLSESSGRW